MKMNHSVQKRLNYFIGTLLFAAVGSSYTDVPKQKMVRKTPVTALECQNLTSMRECPQINLKQLNISLYNCSKKYMKPILFVKYSVSFSKMN